MSKEDKPGAKNHKRFENLVTYLLERFQEAEGYDRVRVVKAMSHYQDVRVVPFALDIVSKGHPDDPVATEALKLLTRKGVRAVVPAVARVVKEHGISSSWLLCLGRIATTDAEAIISRYLRHRNTLLRGSAMFALAMIARESDDALEKLSALIDDSIQAVRTDAINALSVAGKRAIYILVSLINRDASIAIRAINILGDIGESEAVPHLIPLLLNESSGKSDKIPDAAARALKRIGTPAALNAIDVWKNNATSGN